MTSAQQQISANEDCRGPSLSPAGLGVSRLRALSALCMGASLHDGSETEAIWLDAAANEILHLQKALSDLARYFISGNSVPVTRAVIKASDFWRITGMTPNVEFGGGAADRKGRNASATRTPGGTGNEWKSARLPICPTIDR